MLSADELMIGILALVSTVVLLTFVVVMAWPPQQEPLDLTDAATRLLSAQDRLADALRGGTWVVLGGVATFETWSPERCAVEESRALATMRITREA